MGGLAVGGFFVSWLPRGTPHRLASGGTIALSNFAVATKVAAGLVGIFLALVLASGKPPGEE